MDITPELLNKIIFDTDSMTVEKNTSLGTKLEDGTMVVKSSIPFIDFLQGIGRRIPFESGLLPPGTVSIRRAGDYEQFVIVTPPGINTVCWGAYENDKTAKFYSLAQPYRVIVAEYFAGNLLGCRMFYTPKRIDSEDDKLYHLNLPNVNCKGYRGTSVGWICLYHKEKHTDKHIADRIAYAGLRCSGNEAYNDGNMSSTDGPRFYAGRLKSDKSFLWNPQEWEDKTEKEGWRWTLDPDLWIPITVAGIDSQNSHSDSKDAVNLTLKMVMRGNANFYYTDHTPKLYNILSRNDLIKDFDLNQILLEKVIDPVMVSGKTETIKLSAKKESIKKNDESTTATSTSQVEATS